MRAHLVRLGQGHVARQPVDGLEKPKALQVLHERDDVAAAKLTAPKLHSDADIEPRAAARTVAAGLDAAALELVLDASRACPCHRLAEVARTRELRYFLHRT